MLRQSDRTWIRRLSTWQTPARQEWASPFKLVRHEAGLQEFVSFLARKRSSHITVALALEWANQACPPKTGGMGSAAQHCARLRPALERHGSIDRGSTSGSSALSSGTRSAVFLFRPRNPAVARGRQGATSIDPLRCWTYYCLFGLLAVTGLRLREALNLRTEDLD